MKSNFTGSIAIDLPDEVSRIVRTICANIWIRTACLFLVPDLSVVMAV